MRLPQDEGIVVSTLDLLRMWLYDETLAVSELSLKFPPSAYPTFTQGTCLRPRPGKISNRITQKHSDCRTGSSAAAVRPRDSRGYAPLWRKEPGVNPRQHPTWRSRGLRKVAGESFIEWNGGFSAIAGCPSRGAALPAACLC